MDIGFDLARATGTTDAFLSKTVETLTMKRNAQPTQAVAAREEAAKQLRDSQRAAKEVADLCAEAIDRARLAHVPHAGVGTSPDAGT